MQARPFCRGLPGCLPNEEATSPSSWSPDAAAVAGPPWGLVLPDADAEEDPMVSKSPDIISIRPPGAHVKRTRRSARATSHSAHVMAVCPSIRFETHRRTNSAVRRDSVPGRLLRRTRIRSEPDDPSTLRAASTPRKDSFHRSGLASWRLGKVGMISFHRSQKSREWRSALTRPASERPRRRRCLARLGPPTNSACRAHGGCDHHAQRCGLGQVGCRREKATSSPRDLTGRFSTITRSILFQKVERST